MKMMNKKERNQCAGSKAVIDPNKVPDLVIKGIASRVLENLKTNKDLQAQYEAATGKSIFK